jgi:cell wall-associated NlpC family hydrolase
VLALVLAVALAGVIVLVATVTERDQRPTGRPTDAGAATGDVRAVDEFARLYEVRPADWRDGTPLVHGSASVVLRGTSTPVAWLTGGARTVLFANGPQRTWVEPGATRARIVTNDRVGVAPRPWQTGLERTPAFARWFLAAVDPTTEDVLGAAVQYLAGEPDRHQDGVRIAGDAGFGYIHTDDERDGADFYDYLGIEWTFPDTDNGPVEPARRWRGKLDCSGFLRLVYGYRFGVQMYLQPVESTVDGLPRTAAQMATYTRSVVVAAGRTPSRAPTDLTRIQPGDLVFFALHDDPALITHSGIYIGRDTRGGMRFISSRGTVDGPSFGDVRGDGVIDSGYFGARLRKAIRL